MPNRLKLESPLVALGMCLPYWVSSAAWASTTRTETPSFLAASMACGARSLTNCWISCGTHFFTAVPTAPTEPPSAATLSCQSLPVEGALAPWVVSCCSADVPPSCLTSMSAIPKPLPLDKLTDNWWS